MSTELEHAKDTLGEFQRRHDQTVAYARWLLVAVSVLALAVTTLVVVLLAAAAWAPRPIGAGGAV